MKKNLFLSFLLLALLACSAGEKEQDSPVPVPEKRNDPTRADLTPGHTDTLVLTSLDDSVLIASLFQRTIEYMEGVGSVYKGEYVYEGDTGFVEVANRDTIIGTKDTLYFFCVRGPEYYQHGHTLYNQDAALLKKQGHRWVVTDTLDESFVFDPVGLSEVRAIGNYFVLINKHEGSYNGGNFEAGEWFSVIYDGRITGSLGYLSEANNGGSDRCYPPEDLDEEWECDCYSKTGEGGVRIDKKTGILFVEKEETDTYHSGNRCQDSTKVTEKETLACYKGFAKTILETRTAEGKKEIKTNVPVKKFLQEAKMALGEK